MSGLACDSRWYAGLTCDHLYADCPNRTKAAVTLRRYHWWTLGGDTGLDPHGTDVCGLCVHRHNRTEHAGESR